MRILHTYCLNFNLGDYALGYGVKKALRELLPVDLIAETNIQGQIFDPYYIDIINRNYDLLIIGGGGIIHGAHWPQGWFWLIEQELIRNIRIPFVVFAAGYNYFKEEGGIPERGIRHLRETHKYAKLFTVRNDGSYGRLKSQTGIDAKVIADPGFWVGRNQSFARPAHLNNDYIIVQLADDKPNYRFGNEEKRSQFVQGMREAVRELSQKLHVVFAPHVLDDIALSREVAQGIANVSIWNFSEFAFDHVERTFGYYEHASCVLAMRGHGQIVPMSFGVPAISLENHHKHKGLMEEIGLPNLNIDVADPMLTERVLHLVKMSIEDREKIDSHLKNRLNLLWQECKTIVTHAF